MRCHLLVLLAVGCAPKQPAASLSTPRISWAAPLAQSHPLTGSIWRVSDGRRLTETELFAALRSVDVVLLGEKHDNPDHHTLQGRVIRALAPATVAWEMLDHADDVSGSSPADLARTSQWSESGWPDFALYEPVFEGTFAVGATIAPAHPTREQVMTAMREGLGAVEGAEDLSPAPLPAEALASLEREIIDAHCGHAADAMVQMMVRGQVLKDAWMARTLDAASGQSVLIAGNGHTRIDRGVPHYLARSSATVAFVEVSPEASPTSHPADFVWFTPRVTDEDPCEAFRKQLEAMPKGNHE